MEIRPDEFLSFADWFGPALKTLVIAIPILTALAIFICYLISAARRGPVEGFYAVAGVIASAIGRDLPATSLRRIMAMTRLTIKEAIRRKVLVAFVIFVIIFLFAGWFLDVKSDDPAHLYLSFVLTTTSYLVIVLSLFLATSSLPADIKSKTIYTIVTKPVRSGEIVLGRVLGFVAVDQRASGCHVLHQLHVRGARDAARTCGQCGERGQARTALGRRGLTRLGR